MRRLLLTGWLTLALVPLALGQAQSTYINSAVITTPPDQPPIIDATNFINFGAIDWVVEVPISFLDVVNYSNRGILVAWEFQFDTVPNGNIGARHPAGSFYNSTFGEVLAGTGSQTVGLNPPASIETAPLPIPWLQINATNVVNTGYLDVSVDGRMTITGGTVNLSRSYVHVEGFDEEDGLSPLGVVLSSTVPFGAFDNYDAIGSESNALFIANVTEPSPSSPNGLAAIVAPFPAANSVNLNALSPSNIIVQAVYYGDDGGYSPTMRVRWETGAIYSTPVVEWLLAATNTLGVVFTNSFYLTDTLSTTPSNSLVFLDYTLAGEPEGYPSNFSFATSFPGYNGLAQGNTAYSRGLFTNGFSTNAPFSTANTYALWGLTFAPVTYRPDTSNTNQNYTNIPGRVEISAGSLNLTMTKMTSPNFVNLTVSNQFSGSSNAQIIAPLYQLNLTQTNGFLSISNLVQPYIARVLGPIDLYSAAWTNLSMSNMVSTDTNGVSTTNAVTITNQYSVLIVHSALIPTSPVYVQGLTLNGTNVIINDLLNVTNNLLVNALNLTIASNNPGALTSIGQLNVLDTGILWSPSFPILQNVTNAGLITVPNTAFFSHRASPDFPSAGDTPYNRFVNTGDIETMGGVLAWANYFENSTSGTIFTTYGPLSIQATNGNLANGELNAYDGDISIIGGNFGITNMSLTSQFGAINFNVTGQLTDGNIIGNEFSTFDGMNMAVKPATGDLAASTITLESAPGDEVVVTWAGTDLGMVPAGFTNNAAVGHLILFGDDSNSAFEFSAAGASNAIYVDLLELAGSTMDATALDIDPNMTIYYSRAVRGVTDLTGTLDGANGGRMHHVVYAGLFNAGGTLASPVKLNISATSTPTPAVLISFPAAPNSTNAVFYRPITGTSTNWLLLTNIVQGPMSSVVTVVDPIRTNANAYRVQVIPKLP